MFLGTRLSATLIHSKTFDVDSTERNLMNPNTMTAGALAVIGLCLVIGGLTRARPGQQWVWHLCGAVLIVGGIAYHLKAIP